MGRRRSPVRRVARLCRRILSANPAPAALELSTRAARLAANGKLDARAIATGRQRPERIL